ncbi:MAG: hypothetical protein LBJ41_12035 [Treponema sp.]|nr:hypothetical protein [Treponema sp.]
MTHKERATIALNSGILDYVPLIRPELTPRSVQNETPDPSRTNTSFRPERDP